MLDAIINYTFMQNALLAGIFASIVCGIIGTMIVEKKLVSLSGGIAHGSFGGIGFGYFIGIEPIIGGLIFAIASALGVARISRNSKEHSDTLIGIVWATGMAIGIFFISITPGYPPDMNSYLFGDILTVSSVYIKIIIGATVLIVAVVMSIFEYWKSYLFDEEFSSVSGLNVVRMERVLFILTAFSIIVLIKIVGIILAIALLTIPPATSKLFFNNLRSIILSSILLGCFYNLLGLYVSYVYNIPSGATIILLAAFCYMLLSIGKKIIN